MLVKLTDKDGRTYSGCQWGPKVTHTAPGTGELCTAGWIHGYDDCDGEYAGLVADFMNPIHANIDRKTMKFWTISIAGARKDDGPFKFGSQSMTTLKKFRPKHRLTRTQRIAAAILCVKASGYRNRKWARWANRWLSGKDRTRAAARAAADAAWAARAARASDAAWASATAAAATAAAARAAYAAWAAADAAAAARAEASARASDAAWASARATSNGKPLNLKRILIKALKY